MTLLPETLETSFALERPHVLVDPEVGAKVVDAAESFAAHLKESNVQNRKDRTNLT